MLTNTIELEMDNEVSKKIERHAEKVGIEEETTSMIAKDNNDNLSCEQSVRPHFAWLQHKVPVCFTIGSPQRVRI